MSASIARVTSHPSRYIAMLAVSEECRGRGVGTKLIREALKRMHDMKCDQVKPASERLRVESDDSVCRHRQCWRPRSPMAKPSACTSALASSEMRDFQGEVIPGRLRRDSPLRARYYLNGNGAFRLRLWFEYPPERSAAVISPDEPHPVPEAETSGAAAEE